jgi:hypothetical protein
MGQKTIRFAAIAMGAILCACRLSAPVVASPPGMQDAITQDIAQLPMVTSTKRHKPGDPINVGLLGSQDEIIALMQAAGWQRPVRVTLKSSAKIVGSVALHRAYYTAPVSSLFYQGRKQDLAFEKEVGRDARQRHHVRFWKLRDDGPDGRALWLGAATFDKGVGISHRTGAVTHHISGDVDQERAFLVDELKGTERLVGQYTVKGLGPTRAKNGGGDVYWTDGNLIVVEIAPSAAPQMAPAQGAR